MTGRLFNQPLVRARYSRWGLAALAVLGGLVVAACVFHPACREQAVSLWSQLTTHGLAWMLDQHEASPWQTLCLFSLLFAGLSAFSLPGCAVLSLGAGALWGPWWGALFITLSSALGAMLPFWMARQWGRERLARRYPQVLATLDAGVQRAGLRYLFMLRLLPLVPYAVVNPLMGLTPLRAWPFFWVSAAGMWLGSLAYAAAGAGAWWWVGRP